MKLVVDTGALLSIACSRFFEQMLREHTILIPQLVVDELEQFAVYNDFLGAKAKELLEKNFVVKNPRLNVEVKLEKAESAVFALAKEENCVAITDDVHAARVASEKLSIATKPSFYLLLLLFKKGVIEKNDLIDDIHAVLKYRNWLGGALWQYTLSLVEKL